MRPAFFRSSETCFMNSDRMKIAQRQALRGVDQDQRRQRVDQPARHHQLQDRDRAEPDRDHDAERQIEADQRVAAEAVFRQREGRHGAEQQHEEQRGDRDDEAVLEIEDEIALRRAPSCSRSGRRSRASAGDSGEPKIACARLERVHDDQEDREQRDHACRRSGPHGRAMRAGEGGCGAWLICAPLRTGSDAGASG